MDHHRAADGPREHQPSLLVHAGIVGMQTYLSTGVSLLVAIMAAHRTAASQVTAEPAALQGKIDQISAALTED
jgi:hypothetical protein